MPLLDPATGKVHFQDARRGPEPVPQGARTPPKGYRVNKRHGLIISTQEFKGGGLVRWQGQQPDGRLIVALVENPSNSRSMVFTGLVAVAHPRGVMLVRDGADLLQCLRSNQPLPGHTTTRHTLTSWVRRNPDLHKLELEQRVVTLACSEADRETFDPDRLLLAIFGEMLLSPYPPLDPEEAPAWYKRLKILPGVDGRFYRVWGDILVHRYEELGEKELRELNIRHLCVLDETCYLIWVKRGWLLALCWDYKGMELELTIEVGYEVAQQIIQTGKCPVELQRQVESQQIAAEERVG